MDFGKSYEVPNLSVSLCKTYPFGMVFICSCRVAHGPRFPWIVNYRDKKVRGGGGGRRRKRKRKRREDREKEKYKI